MGSTHYYIALGTALAFLLPLFRQYNSNYFVYFLCLALAGISAITLQVAGVDPNIANYLFTHMIIFYFQVNDENFTGKKSIILLHFVSAFTVYFFLTYPFTSAYFLILHLIVIGYIIIRWFEHAQKHLVMPFFYIFLTLYEITIVMRELALILNLESGVYYYTLISLFQIFIALIFAFLREDNKRFVIRITDNAELLAHVKDPDMLIKKRFEEES